MKTKLLLITLFALACGASANTNNPPVKITALHQSVNELKIKADLEQLQKKYDLSRWTYTHTGTS
ncbi:MAG: hypothetical protein U5L02_18100 [Rheinheimera sp.]|nr:hypothetical protein [Rheinheimera sp.]